MQVHLQIKNPLLTVILQLPIQLLNISGYIVWYVHVSMTHVLMRFIKCSITTWEYKHAT